MRLLKTTSTSAGRRSVVAPRKRELVQKLRAYLTLQFEAYQLRDWDMYDQLEDKIRIIETKL